MRFRPDRARAFSAWLLTKQRVMLSRPLCKIRTKGGVPGVLLRHELKLF